MANVDCKAEGLSFLYVSLYGGVDIRQLS